MSGPIKDGGAAFPCEQSHTPEGTWNQTFEPGMSLRDYFAAAALAQLPVKWDGGYSKHDRDIGAPRREAMWTARAAYRMADAMLAAREAPP